MSGTKQPETSLRADTIVKGLIATKRAVGAIKVDRGMLRIACASGGYYWIAFNGKHVSRGRSWSDMEELQPKFVAMMERAGYRMLEGKPKWQPMHSAWPA